jgi:hypothetical protein
VRLLPIGQKKGHLLEIQVNGGTVEQKVDFAKSLFEKAVTVDAVFQPNEMIDTIAITKVRGGCGGRGVCRLFLRGVGGSYSAAPKAAACLVQQHPPMCICWLACAGLVLYSNTGTHHWAAWFVPSFAVLWFDSFHLPCVPPCRVVVRRVW